MRRVNAIFKDFPKWQSVYYYFRLWRNSNDWQRLHDTLRAEVRRAAHRHKHPTGGCLDSQSLKTTPSAFERAASMRRKTSTGGERHLLVDTLGLVLSGAVTAASVPGARWRTATVGTRGRFV